MKKLILWSVLLLCGTQVTFAQNKNITVSGTVVEAESKEPAIQATVQLLSLPDSTYIAGIATLGKGYFTLPKVKEGKYVLKVSYIGFRPSYLPLQLKDSSPNVNVGTIALQSDAILLQEAVITAEAPPVTVKEDTIVFAASAYRTAEGAMLEELVKKLPGVEISEDGKLMHKGKEISKIMVDGKEFFSDDPQVAMKNLPANMVENVKAYEKKSDMTRLTGIDDGNEEAVLDLTVKKGMKQGWIGNMLAGYGNKDRYEAGGMMSRFLDDANFSIVTSLNNTNNQGFTEFGDTGQGMSRGGGGAGAGITASKTVGLNFAKDTKKYQIGGNVRYGYSDNDAQRNSFTENFLGENSSTEEAGNLSRRKRHDVRADFRFEWKLDSMTTIIFRPNASFSQTESTTSSFSNEWRGEQQMNGRETSSLNSNDNYSLGGRLQLFRKLNSKGRNLFLSANFGYTDNEGDGDNTTDNKFYDGTEIDPDKSYTTNRHTESESDNRNWGASATYTEPVFKNHFLQARYEFSHQKRLSQSLVSDETTLPGEYIESLSNRVENFYDRHTANLSIRGVYTNMWYNAGVSLLPQSSESETTIGPNKDSNLPKQNVLNFAPQVMFRYMFTKQNTLTIRYNGRSSEPDIKDLQEVIDQTDPMNIRYGNPGLKPSFTHNFMLAHNIYKPTTMRSYTYRLSYNNTQNAVADKMTLVNSETGERTYRRVNINGNWNANGYFSFLTPFKNKKFTFTSNSNAMLSDAVSYTSSTKEEDAVLSTTHRIRLQEEVVGSYRSDYFDLSLNARINYDKTENKKSTNNNQETFDYFLGGNTNIRLPWNLEISSDIRYRIKDGYSGSYNKNEAIWNAQVSKTLFKGNAGTIRIKIYDILKQQTNLTRSISGSSRTDSQTNTLGSYFMVHFVYRINTLGGRSVRRAPMGGPNGRPRGDYGGGRPGGYGGGGGGHRF